MRPPLRSRPVIATVATVALAAGAVLTSALAAQAATDCRVSYTVQSQWAGGFVANVDVANLGVPCTGTVEPSAPGSSPTPSASTSPSPAPASNVLDQVSTVARLKTTDSGVQYTWPGTYFEGRFRGTGLGVVLNDSTNDYVIAVDGSTVATLVTPGQTTHWIRDLPDGDHTVRLAKRTESPWAAGEFGGLVPTDGGAILTRPAARSRQIEFIGDSWTAGYGNMSTSRDCAGTGGVNRNSNADAAFGALTARGLSADYQINAWSGLGMVRNYNGQTPETTFPTYYETDLQALWNSTVWPVPSTWRPHVVVIGLGINDFSTALNAGEKWATIDALAADYRTAYLAFIDKLRTRYGAGTQIVLTYPDLSYLTTALADSIQQIVKTRNDGGDARVSSVYYDNNTLALDLLGCDWHPSQHDHQILATTVTRHIATLPIDW